MMSENFNSDSPTPPDAWKAPDPIDAALRHRVAVPDQTRQIMGRLGYMRVGSGIARRQRRAGQIQRLACLLLMAAAAAVGYTWYHSAGDIRRAEEVTLPGAFAGQMEQRGAALTGFLESIRPIEPGFAVQMDEQPSETQPNVILPVEQPDSGDLPMIEVPGNDEPATVAIAPFRWT